MKFLYQSTIGWSAGKYGWTGMKPSVYIRMCVVQPHIRHVQDVYNNYRVHEGFTRRYVLQDKQEVIVVLKEAPL